MVSEFTLQKVNYIIYSKVLFQQKIKYLLRGMLTSSNMRPLAITVSIWRHFRVQGSKIIRIIILSIPRSFVIDSELRFRFSKTRKTSQNRHTHILHINCRFCAIKQQQQQPQLHSLAIVSGFRCFFLVFF